MRAGMGARGIFDNGVLCERCRGARRFGRRAWRRYLDGAGDRWPD